MATLKEFEAALREQGMRQALAILDKLRERDRKERKVGAARRVVGRKMTPELARRILDLHETTKMTQQEIAFELGVNQGRVNEVIKHGKWLVDDPAAPEAVARDRALARIRQERPKPKASAKPKASTKPRRKVAPQLALF
ncbi:RNA polymerase subunit sigma-70 [Rubellimicrobium rubrum]|uniref:RNA polymerase subunit sigma-70 n=1 Tax=Rubellimicrobium rubrum TaxID=2585369 RepID=A0A5C4MLH3_9RHOB|nr:RNA polymerase subunit sigma-70 [Rubellimicrobium rubrum]TNC46157.1 RNA polymerase subunit sigma-70 [Rubellimicrobium rubrum]